MAWGYRRIRSVKNMYILIYEGQSEYVHVDILAI